jgi:hypothetical protein
VKLVLKLPAYVQTLLGRYNREDVEHLKHVVSQLRRSSHITGTRTLMVLDSWKRTP